MALKIYKSGQGYWTRLVSGISGGVLTVGFAMWIHDKLSTLKSDNKIYIQWGVAVGIVLVAGLFLYHWVAVRQRSCDFLIATEGEMKKVNWPTRHELIGSTWIVICCVAIFVGILFGADLLFANLFDFVGILEK